MATTHLLTPPRVHHPPPSASSSVARVRATASLAHPLHLCRLRLAAPRSRSPSPRHGRRAMSVRSSLIDPDGGALVELVAPPDRLPALRAEAEALPRVRLAPVDLQWAHVLAEGWASPLRGFMREHEYLQSLHFNCVRLPDGGLVNMSLPIVLAIGDADKEQIGGKPDVALQGPDGGVVAILRRYVRPDPPPFLIPTKKHAFLVLCVLRAKSLLPFRHSWFEANTKGTAFLYCINCDFG